jgi:hypothetical protein
LTDSVIIDVNESLGRYIISKRHFSREKNEVNFRLFMPPPDLHLSVYRIDGLKLKEIWDIGQNNVINVQKEPKTLYGVASIRVKDVENEKLTVDPDNNPHLHANIVGWPEEQDAQMDIAIIFAAKAIPVFK